MRRFFYSLWEFAEVFLIAFLAVWVIKYFLIQPFIVNGASMEPSFYGGDYLLIDEISYRFREPQRGEVVVFHPPQDKSIFYIKRIIGLPYERVEIGKEGVKIYNQSYPQGFLLYEPYVKGETYGTKVKYQSVTLREGEYFVMGDNRVGSFDSRHWGPLPRENIVGLVKVRLWPPNALAFFSPLDYLATSSFSN